MGRGGMGTVHAAFDTVLQRHVALKRLISSSARSAELFEREYRTLAGLRHPRIVEVHEYGLDEQGAFYTMERLHGADLTGLSPMPWRETCACLRDAASILGVLHARRLVHRDLSAKNLWRTPEGRLKLLDFGALTPFGPAREVVGTAPFVPPEALAGESLDQRADLYALGALGYWLLTGAHAYPARTLDDLPEAWRSEPAPPSALVRLLRGGATAPDPESDVPAELDRLILSLLSQSASERPASTVELIDALNAIADLEKEAQDVVVDGYLNSSAFVGREEAQRRFSRSLERAQKSVHPQALLFTGPEGIGRSRLLDSLSTSARVAGATVVRADGRAGDRPYGVANQLALDLLRAAPKAARSAARPFAAVLGHLSPSLRAALGHRPVAQDLRGAAGERARKQLALTEWFLAVAEQRTLVILVDDLQEMDEESQALLAALAHGSRAQGLVLVTTLRVDAQDSLSLAARSFREVARGVELEPLGLAETTELLRSLFGPVPHLERLAARLHGVTEGNPRHLSLSCEHLVRSGLVRYADGSWSLPSEVATTDLPASLQAGLRVGVERLSERARRLAIRLSVPDHGSFDIAMCAALCQPHESDANELLDELRRVGVVRESGEGFRFAHPSLRDALVQELADDERVEAHRLLGGALAETAGDDRVLQLRASLHLLRAGKWRRGRALLDRAAQEESQAVSESLHATAPMFQEAVSILRSRGLRDRDMLLPLTVLAVASYYVEPRYALPDGQRAVPALEAALHLRWARRLQPLLGPKWSLLLALVWSALALRLRGQFASLPTAVHCFMFSCSCLAGRATTSMQPERARHYARAIEPLTGLGPSHAVSMAYRFAHMVAMTTLECSAAHFRVSAELRDWLASDAPIEGLNDSVRQVYLASCWFTWGVRGSFLNDGTALLAAEKLDDFGPQFSVNANQLRTMHHASYGDFEKAAEYRAQMGVRAIQLGTAWRIDTFAPSVTVPAIWARDAIATKRAADQLDRLTEAFPAYRYHASSALAAYHVMRGKPQAAVDVLEHEPEDLFVIGSARTRGVLASAYNALGQHGRARAICHAALAELTEEDLAFVSLSGNLQVELAIAEAGLTHYGPARARLDGLLAQHTDKGPLLRAFLHRARAQVACMEGDDRACRCHVALALDFARRTTSPSLLAWIKELEWELRRTSLPESGELSTLSGLGRDQLALGVRLMLGSEGEAPVAQLAQKALAVALELTGGQSGFLLSQLAGDVQVTAQCGEVSPELERWAQECLGSPDEGDATAVLASESASTCERSDPMVRELGTTFYRVMPIWAGYGRDTLPVGVLVVGADRQPPSRLGADVLRVLAESLTECVTVPDLQRTSA